MTTILVVEDAAVLGNIIVQELEAAGFRALLATDGQVALDIHQREQPDLVILDWMLPEVDGLEVLRRIRSVSVTPVLMLTARGDEVDRVIGLEVGADDYLTKPFGMRELVARIRAQLRRDELLRQTLARDRDDRAIVSYGSLHLDPSAFLATLDGQAVALTASEFTLLHLLVRNPGRTFTRSYLVETVWKEQAVGPNRTVDNTILRLRKKIPLLEQEIETVWGVGYRLRPLPSHR